MLLTLGMCAGPVAGPARGQGDADESVQLTIAASGDLLVHEPVWRRARANGGGHYDFRPMLRFLRPTVRGADVALCHVETPMSRRPPAGYPVFNTPAALADAIRWAGYDVCSTASNHSLDQGQSGIRSTAAALDRQDIPHTGSFGSGAAQRRSTIVTVKGVKVAFLAYTEMTNGIRPPHPWSVNIARSRRILADARRARAPRRPGGRRQSPLGSRIPVEAEPLPAPPCGSAHADRPDHSGGGTARTRRTADLADQRPDRGVRRGQPALESERRVLSGGQPGRADRHAADLGQQG